VAVFRNVVVVGIERFSGDAGTRRESVEFEQRVVAH
jgi:hypothetical protein